MLETRLSQMVDELIPEGVSPFLLSTAPRRIGSSRTIMSWLILRVGKERFVMPILRSRSATRGMPCRPVWRHESAFGKVVAMTSMLPAPRLLAGGFVMIESGRWHDGRLWFAHWGAGEVVAVDLRGQIEVMTLLPRRLATE